MARSTVASVGAAGVCPECGTPVSVRRLPAPWWARRRGLIRALVLLVALGWVGWKQWGAWPALSAPTAFGPGVGSVDFPKRRYTHDDVERIAAGMGRDARLAATIWGHPDGIPNAEVTAAFVAPVGQATDFQRIGWPLEWLVYRRDAQYDDVYARTNAKATPPKLWPGWYGWAHIRPRIDAAGWKETRLFIPEGFAGAVILLIAAWGAGRVARWAAFAGGLARVGGVRRRDRAARGLPAAGAAAAAVLIVAMSLHAPVRSDMLLPVPWMPPTAPTGLTVADIVRLRDEPGGDGKVARAILDACATLGSTAGDTLLIGWSQPGQEVGSGPGGWPRGLAYLSKSEQTGYKPGGKASVSWSADRHGLAITVQRAGAARAVWTIAISLKEVAGVVLGLWLVSQATGLTVAGAAYLRVRRAAKRAASGWCVRCGYDLAGLGSG